MTSLALVTPLLFALAVAAGVAPFHRRLPPQLAARLLAASLLVLVATALATFWAVAVTWLWHIPSVHAALGWCPAPFGHHHPMPMRFGLPAVALAIYGTLGAASVLRSHLHLCRHGRCPVHVADSVQPFAVTLPGRGGQVVVSSGLLRLLDARERIVVLAHEAAHADCRHDRYQLLARLAERSVPVLRPLSARLQFSLERWADEHAVRACGDRRLVAQTVGKVALSSWNSGGALAFDGAGVSARVRSLLAPPSSAPGSLAGSVLVSALVAMTTLAAYQFHHLALLLRAACLH